MKLKNLYVLVDNTDRAISFYTNVLGFELYRRQDRYTILKLEDIWFGLLNQKFVNATHRGNNCIPVFEVENLQFEYERLKEAGVVFVTDIVELEDVIFFQLYDTEGNMLEMYEEKK
jgi:predicted enzyme related to lactoylglutathione lyase